MWFGLTLIILLIFSSIYGAFIGAERAKAFFNSQSLAIYWLILILLLIVGIFVFRRLIRATGLLFIHAGCVLILAGAIWGSQAGHKIQSKIFGIDKIPSGQMQIYEGYAENRVLLEDNETIKELPFYVQLKDFRIEYYKPDFLLVQTRQGKSWRIPVEIGRETSLGDDVGSVKILRAFENFKLKSEDGKYVPYDDPQPASNPTLGVEIKLSNGQVVTRYVFERFTGHIYPEDKFLLRYQRVISDYISELQIIRDNEVIAQKNIEVNYPLHFGGYHFYQADYDKEEGQYTILMVASDTGITIVYAGFLMLCAGVFWHFWLKHIFTTIKTKRE
jgi:signal transduction histidine kinase